MNTVVQDQAAERNSEVPQDFHDFYTNRLQKLTSSELRQAFGIFSYFRAGMSDSIADQAANWVAFATPLDETIDWFEAMHCHLGEEKTSANFASLTNEQKAIVQRGYELRYQGLYGPQRFGQYFTVLAESYDPFNPTGFPVMRYRADLEEGEYVWRESEEEDGEG